MNEKPKKPIPFIVAVGGVTFMIRFNEDCEIHSLSSKDDKNNPAVNWTEKLPKGTTPP